jgi:hypothetical protein
MLISITLMGNHTSLVCIMPLSGFYYMQSTGVAKSVIRVMLPIDIKSARNTHHAQA